MTRPLALVTGASGGIGLELARLAARDGHDLVLVARHGDALDRIRHELAAAYQIEAQALPADLTDPEAPRDIVDNLAGREVDVLINNAGVGGYGRFAVERSLADDLAMVRLNITSLVELTGLLLPGMVERGRGGVLNVASAAAFAPGPLMAVYYASKAFVLSFSEALAEEARADGVRVCALCPGPVDTGFAAAAGLEGSWLARLPLRVSAPDVAAAGWDGLRRGRPVVVPGVATKLAVESLRITPRRLAVTVTKLGQRRAAGR